LSPTAHKDNEWQRIWFAVRGQAWTSLALVPGSAGIDSARIAESLTAMGRVHAERPVTLINATGVEITNVQAVIDAISASVARGERAIVAVGAITEQPSTVAVAQATSAVLLLVRLGESQLDAAQSTLLAIGRDRFLGSVVLDAQMRATLR
jgi:hypothetical protein